MFKTILKRSYLGEWKIGENESWFSDMSAEGLHLTGFSYSGESARFERGEPERHKYRVDFAASEQIPSISDEHGSFPIK